MKWNVKTAMLLTLGAAAMAVVAIVFLRARSTPLPKPVFIPTKNQPTLGNPHAKIHFVIFEDLKCYNCMRYTLTVYPEIQKKYIDTGKASYTITNLAFIPNSMPAANAARCVYVQNKKSFFTYIKNIYDHQPPEDEDWATIPTLMNFAKNLPGVDQQKLSQCLYESPYTNCIENNLKIGLTVMQGTIETPTLYINGYKVNPLTIEQINRITREIS